MKIHCVVLNWNDWASTILCVKSLFDNGVAAEHIQAEVCRRIMEHTALMLRSRGHEVLSVQSDSLAAIVGASDGFGAEVFVSIHCNAANTVAKGTEVECYGPGEGERLAQCIQNQIVGSLGTVDRGVKHMPKLLVLRKTLMTSVLVEMAFIDQDEDCQLLTEKTDEFARAIARGISDYQ